MAEEFYLSRPYLSAKFKQETGWTLTDFILSEKTEEAKRLILPRVTSAASSGGMPDRIPEITWKNTGNEAVVPPLCSPRRKS